MAFGVVEWGALSFLVALVMACGGSLWRLATRLSNVESKASAAADSVVSNIVRVETVARQLSEHKEQVAVNYVSNRALENLENRLVDAIGKLGDRLDRLFTSGKAVTN